MDGAAILTRRAEVLAIVPARGGSRSIPRKNLRPLAGHPLIAYAIAAAREARGVGRVLVSTDDAEIREAGLRYGAEAPFLRPPELARDDTTDLPVFAHALRWLEEHEGYRPEIVIQLRPTSPLRPPRLVDEAVSLLVNRPEAHSVRSVTPAGQNPYKMWRITQGYLDPLLASGAAEPYNEPRQTLPPTLWQTGHVDAVRRATILEHRSMTGVRVLPLVVDARYAVDIDTTDQLALAEWQLARGTLDVVRPVRSGPHECDNVRLVAFDFDGVFTNNRVYVDEHGREMVSASRADGLGLAALRQRGIDLCVISTETNPVVSVRCRKLGIECIQGVSDKAVALKVLATRYNVPLREVAFIGNDVNDLPALRIAGLAAVVADAHPSTFAVAHHVLSRAGGHGAVREMCDWLQARQDEKGAVDGTSGTYRQALGG